MTHPNIEIDRSIVRSPITSTALRIVVVSLLMFTALVAQGFVLVLPISHQRLVAFLSLCVVYAISARPTSTERCIAAAVVLLAGIPLSGRFAGAEGTSLQIGLGLAALILFGHREDLLRRSDIAAIMAFFAFEFAVRRLDFLWYALERLSWAYSDIVATLTPMSPRWGPAASGVHAMLCGVALIVASLGTGNRRRLRWAIPALLVVVAAPIGVIAAGCAHHGVAVLARGFRSGLPFVMQAAFLLPIAAAVAIATKRGEPISETDEARQDEIAPRKEHRAFSLALAGVVAWIPVAQMLGPSRTAPTADGDVLFLERCERGLLNFDRPEWKSLGFGMSGLYGNLVELLRVNGHESRFHRGPLTDRELEGCRVVVIILPVEPFADDELARLEAFVDRGGSLFVLTDHTDLLGVAGPTNAVLSRYGIETRFDTGVETRRAFLGNLEFRSGGPFVGDIEANDLQILHGATFRLTPPASPVIVGRHMFADFGNRLNGGQGAYLGDYGMAPASERVGDVVVMASARAGRGRVLAFGDTSSLQNVALGRSTAAVVDMFDWLYGKDVDSPKTSGSILLALCLAAFASFRIDRLRFSISNAAILGISATLAAIAPTEAEVDNVRALDRLPPDGALVVHNGNLPRFDTDQFQNTSIEGPLMCAGRERLVGVMGDLEQARTLDAAKVIMIAAPGSELSEDLCDRLDRRLAEGAVVVVSAGYEESSGVAEFLARHDMKILPVPLGAAPVMTYEKRARYKGPEFLEAWAVQAPHDESTTRYFKVGDCDAVVSRTIGKGRLVVIGDSWFLTDKNLEGEQAVKVDNVDLLCRLLGHVGGLEECRR